MRSDFKTVLILLILVAHNLCNAQNLTVTFSDIGKSRSFKISTIHCDDSLSIQKVLNNCLLPLYSKGYLAASIDSFSCDSAKVIAYGIMGIQYKWFKLIPDSISTILLNQAGIKAPSFSNKPVNPKLLVRYINSTLNQLENIGYPFARAKLDRVEIDNNKLSAALNIDRGSMVIIDTVYFKGNARISPMKFGTLIDLKKGELYSESKIKRIDEKIKQQQYLSLIKPSEVEFLNQKARIYCYVDNRIASRFWGLAGFYSDKTDGKLKLNGDLNLALVNSLRSGEKINFSWSAPGQGTQNFNLNTDWPYILGWQIGIVGSFSLYRRDSTYITINPKLSVSFFTTNGGRFLLNLDYKKTSSTSNNSVLPSQYGNTSSLLYGFGYEYSNYDILALPNRGLLIKTVVNTGSRNVNQNKNHTSDIIEAELNSEGFIPIYEHRIILALHSNSKARALYNAKGSASLFENEMYRIGGMGTIRGFNQESILSTIYSIATVELHLRMSEGSGVYLFADKGFVKAYELGHRIDTWPLGLGVGLNMLTKAGLFNLSYALGQGFGQSIGFKDAKVHFGVMTTF